ncbi:MAG: hypothetical protein ACREXX_17615 [Gammaproteobacteria bacterium]
MFRRVAQNGNYKDADRRVIQADGSGSRFERADQGLTHPSNGGPGSRENQHRPNAPGDMRALRSALMLSLQELADHQPHPLMHD